MADLFRLEATISKKATTQLKVEIITFDKSYYEMFLYQLNQGVTLEN